jgi:hypothetical protein
MEPLSTCQCVGDAGVWLRVWGVGRPERGTDKDGAVVPTGAYGGFGDVEGEWERGTP